LKERQERELQPQRERNSPALEEFDDEEQKELRDMTPFS
jgi:hypothetical protein